MLSKEPEPEPSQSQSQSQRLFRQKREPEPSHLFFYVKEGAKSRAIKKMAWLSIPGVYPTKHVNILKQHLYCALFAPSFYSGAENAFFLYRFSIMIKQMYARTVPFNGVIWDEFVEQHQHQII